MNSSTVKPEIATVYFDSRNHGAAKASSTHLAETLFSLFDENNHPRKPCRLPCSRACVVVSSAKPPPYLVF